MRHWGELFAAGYWNSDSSPAAGNNQPREQHPKARRLASEALAIDAEEAKRAGALGFMARILVQASLPHRRPRSHEFERVNGCFSLYMNAPPSVGLPYGSYPRLVLAWLSTEAVRTRSRQLALGPTFTSFMEKLGIPSITGKRGTASRLRGQIHRLFSTTIRCSFCDEAQQHAAGRGYTIAHEHHLWWSPRDPSQTPLWNSLVVLSADFFDEVVHHRARRFTSPEGPPGLPAGARHLRLANPPPQLPQAADDDPVGGTRRSVRR